MIDSDLRKIPKNQFSAGHNGRTPRVASLGAGRGPFIPRPALTITKTWRIYRCLNYENVEKRMGVNFTR